MNFHDRLPDPMTDPWDWYIYLHEWLIFMVNVGIYIYTIHGSYGLGNNSGTLF